MAINLNKKASEEQYYYSEGGETFGPFSLPILLTKIKPETLVYREGIEWTRADGIEELKYIFSQVQANAAAKVNQHQAPNQNTTPVETPAATQQAQASVEKQKMFQAPYSFQGRIRRTEYCLTIIMYVVSYSILSVMAESISIAAVGFIPLFWFALAQGAKRCHDRGNSGWFQIIPFYGIWMMFAEGDPRVNEYGNPPK